MQNEDDLVCDFAEYYHIYDWRALPLRMAATLAAGLRPSSRSAMKRRGQRVTTEEAILSVLRDEVLVLIHQQSGMKLKKTDLISDKFINGEKPQNIKSFAQGDDFLAAWEALNG